MSDPVTMLREARAKAEAKVGRLRSQLAIAEREFEELETAVRVFDRISGNGPSPGPNAAATNENGTLIWSFVGIGEENGMAPKDVHEALVAAGHDLNADLVRTQLWRMAKRETLASESGKYWRPVDSRKSEEKKAPSDFDSEGAFEVGPDDGSQGSPSQLTPEGSIPSGSTFTTSRRGWDDLDDDVPF